MTRREEGSFCDEAVSARRPARPQWQETDLYPLKRALRFFYPGQRLGVQFFILLYSSVIICVLFAAIKGLRTFKVLLFWTNTAGCPLPSARAALMSPVPTCAAAGPWQLGQLRWHGHLATLTALWGLKGWPPLVPRGACPASAGGECLLLHVAWGVWVAVRLWTGAYYFLGTESGKRLLGLLTKRI